MNTKYSNNINTPHAMQQKQPINIIKVLKNTFKKKIRVIITYIKYIGGISMEKKLVSSGVDIFAIANIFIHELENVSNKKLLKLLYFTEAWFMADNNDIEENDQTLSVLFDEEIIAWQHGPVYKCVYDKYKVNSWHIIPTTYENYQRPDLDPTISELIDEIINLYGRKSANELELISHEDEEWKNKHIGKNKMEKVNVFEEYIKKYEN
jgi:uncharacterized phage-associated protein